MDGTAAGSLYADIAAYYALDLTEYHMHMHAHPRCEIMYVVDGSCDIVLSDHTCTLHKNQFIFLDSDVPHRLRIEKPKACSILNLEFVLGPEDGEIPLREIREESPLVSGFLDNMEPFYEGTDTENLGYAIKDLILHLKSKDGKEGNYLKRILFYRVLLELAAACRKKKPASGIVYLRKACAYINEHLTEELRVPQIASAAGINKSYLHALFSQHMHCTITDYINTGRLELAAFLLGNSSMSVTDIAFQSGYNSRQYFAAAFEKSYGISPRAYRRLHAKNLVPSTGVSQICRSEDGDWSEHILSE